MAFISGIIPFLISIVILFRLYAKFKLSYWKRRGVQSLTTDVIFGNFKEALLFRKAPGWFLGQLHKAAKPDAPLLGFYIFHKPCVLIRDPEIIKQMFVTDFENFSDRHFAGTKQKDSTGMKNLFGLKNPTWKYVRSKITPTLTRGKIRQMLPLMMETGEPLMHYLENQRADEHGIRHADAQNLSLKHCTDLTASIAFGTKTDSFRGLNSEFSHAFMDFFQGIKRMTALIAVFFIPEIIEFYGGGVFVKPDFVKQVFWDALKSREETKEKRGDFIDSLIKIKNEEQNSDFKMDGENLLFQSGMFLSGFESSATTTAFTLMELANNHEFQKEAREDINKAIEKHGLTYEAFSEMKYLDQCISESIRLHPPISTLDRYTRQDYKIPGTDVVIEKGTAVYVSLYGMHEDERFFEDPLTFNPNRFDNDAKISDAYLPFGIGPRSCVATKLGQLHVKVVLATILREYSVNQLIKDKAILNPKSTFTAAANGINLQFKKIVS